MENFFRNWSKKQKIGVGAACVVCLLGFGVVVVGADLASSFETEKATQRMEEKESKETAYSQKVLSLVNEVYSDKTMESLSPTFDQKKSVKVKEVLADAPKGVKSKSLQANENQLTNALHMFTVITELNNAYEKEGVVKADAKLTDTEGLLVQLKESKPTFYAEQQKRATEVKNEIAVIADTTKAVNELFTDQAKTIVKEDVSKESYTAVLAKVEGLKQAGLKGSLLTSLAAVDAKVTEKELAAATVEAEKAAQESAVAAEEQAAQNQVVASNNQTYSNEASNNQASSSVAPSYEAIPEQSAPVKSQAPQPASPAPAPSGGNSPGTTWTGEQTGEGSINMEDGSATGNTWNSFDW